MHVLRQAKAEYVKDNLNNNQNDPKKCWKNIHNILPTNDNNKRNILLNDIGTNDREEKCWINCISRIVPRGLNHLD